MLLHFKYNKGFSLIEVLILIIIVGIVLATAMQWMSSSVGDYRRTKTKYEMSILAGAIVGNPDIVVNGVRSDFGYIGDIGAFPPNLTALIVNPGGLATWDGPYLPAGFTQDSISFLTDEWGQPYTYSGGITISSAGGGAAIVKKIANAASDYLLNWCYGTILDADDSIPGPIMKDSIDIEITIPDGAGAAVTKLYNPDASGVFILDSLPAGKHALNIIYKPLSDTLHRYLTILPRHKSSPEYKFAGAYFSSGGTGCTGGGTLVLRPNGVGSRTEFNTGGGCSDNWECVDDEIPDENSTRVRIRSSSYHTDTYSISDPSSNPCNISGVTVYVRAQKLTLFISGYVRPVINVGGIEYEGSEHTVTNSYTDYSHQWNSNPFTGADWTWSDIENLEIGLRMKTSSPLFDINCTQVWAEIDYGP